jgi:hypothetical protein
MQSKAIQSWETSNLQALPAFGVGVGFVDESALSVRPEHETETATEDIKSIVSSLSPGNKQVHFAPLEDVFSSGSKDKAARLKEVLGMIDDETGRDDFVQCLRMLSLQKVLPFSACPCFQVLFGMELTIMLIFCSDCTGKWLHQDHARDMRFWNSMSCAICHREGILLIW